MDSMFSFLRSRKRPTTGAPPAPTPKEKPTPAQPVVAEVVTTKNITVVETTVAMGVAVAPAPVAGAQPAPHATAMPAPFAAPVSRAVGASDTGNPGQAFTRALDFLKHYVDSLPSPSLSTISVIERPLGLGNWRGVDRRIGFELRALKGSRLDMVVRFQFLAGDADAANAAVNSLQGRLLTARNELWAAGLLRVAPEATAPATFDAAGNIWRSSADYRVLYEFYYEDADGAESLIARIPISMTSDASSANSATELMTVTEGMARWDNEAAPTLMVRGRQTLASVSALVFVPGAAPTGAVTLTRTHDRSSGQPTQVANLAEFLVSHERHAQLRFATFSDFMAAFGGISAAGVLGDWNLDGAGDSYEAGVLDFQPALVLAEATERFEVAYDGAQFDNVAVVYLRLRVRG